MRKTMQNLAIRLCFMLLSVKPLVWVVLIGAGMLYYATVKTWQAFCPLCAVFS
jgi:hypothetical protein